MSLIAKLEPIFWKFIFIGTVILVGLIIFKLISFKVKGESIGRAISGGSVNRTIRGSGLKKGYAPEGFIFGFQRRKKIYLENIKEGHITIFGGSGKGKTAALLIPSLRAWGSPFFAIDISGDISKNVKLDKDKKLVLNPEDPERSAIYNVFYFIDRAITEDEKRQRLEQLVMLIIDIPKNANDANQYFLETARKIFLAGLLAFYNIGMDFTEICKTIYFNGIEDLAKLINETGNRLALSYIKPLFGENEKNISGAKSALNTKIKIFSDNTSMEKILRRSNVGDECFNPAMLEEKSVFLKVSDVKQEFYTPFIHIVVAQILEYISGREYDRKKDKRILLALDEFASIGHLNVISPFRKFRKNGCNICILTQSIIDIDLVYSEKERKVILDNSKYITVLGATDNTTREYFSNLIGKVDVKKKSTSSGRGGSSTSISTQKDYVIQPEEWKDLGEELVVVHPSGFMKLKKNYYFNEDLSKGISE